VGDSAHVRAGPHRGRQHGEARVFPFIARWRDPARVIITATNTTSQRYHTVFPEGFVEALSSDAADVDKNSRSSLLEAFTYATRLVAQHYERAGTMATETGAIDDDGDGKPRTGPATGPDGNVAALTYLDSAVAATSTDPEMQKLLVRQQGAHGAGRRPAPPAGVDARQRNTRASSRSCSRSWHLCRVTSD
jgi:hypothetical protein